MPETNVQINVTGNASEELQRIAGSLQRIDRQLTDLRPRLNLTITGNAQAQLQSITSAAQQLDTRLTAIRANSVINFNTQGALRELQRIGRELDSVRSRGGRVPISIELSGTGAQSLQQLLNRLRDLTRRPRLVTINVGGRAREQLDRMRQRLNDLTRRPRLLTINLGGTAGERITRLLNRLRDLTRRPRLLTINLGGTANDRLTRLFNRLRDLTRRPRLITLNVGGTANERITRLANRLRDLTRRPRLVTINLGGRAASRIDQLVTRLNNLTRRPRLITVNLGGRANSQLTQLQTRLTNLTRRPRLVTLNLSDRTETRLNRLVTRLNNLTRRPRLITVNLGGNALRQITQLENRLNNLTRRPRLITFNVGGNAGSRINQLFQRIADLTRRPRLLTLNVAGTAARRIEELIARLRDLTRRPRLLTINLAGQAFERINSLIGRLADLTRRPRLVTINLAGRASERIRQLISQLQDLTRRPRLLTVNLAGRALERINSLIGRIQELTRRSRLITINLAGSARERINSLIQRLQDLTRRPRLLTINLAGRANERINQLIQRLQDLTRRPRLLTINLAGRAYERINQLIARLGDLTRRPRLLTINLAGLAFERINQLIGRLQDLTRRPRLLTINLAGRAFEQINSLIQRFNELTRRPRLLTVNLAGRAYERIQQLFNRLADLTRRPRLLTVNLGGSLRMGLDRARMFLSDLTRRPRLVTMNLAGNAFERITGFIDRIRELTRRPRLVTVNMGGNIEESLRRVQAQINNLAAAALPTRRPPARAVGDAGFLSRIAIPLVGGRGGDQSVIRDLENFDGNESARRLRPVQTAIGRIATDARSFLTSIALFGAGAGLVAAVRNFGTLEEEINRIGENVQATSEELITVRETLDQVGRDTRFDPQQAAGALRQLTQSGFELAEALELLPNVLNLSIISGDDLASSAFVASTIVNGYTLEIERASEAIDVLAQLSTMSAGTVGTLGDQLARTGSSLGVIGQDYREVAAALGVIADRGDIERGATGLEGLARALQRPNENFQALLEQYGVTLQEINPAANRLIDIFERLDEAQIPIDAFGNVGAIEAEGQRVFNTLLVGVDRFRELTDATEEADGRAQEMVRNIDTGFNNSLIQLSSSVTNLGLKFVESMEEPLTRILGLIRDLANSMAENETLLTTLAATLGSIASAYTASGFVRGIGAFGTAMVNLGSNARNIATAAGAFALISSGLAAVAGVTAVISFLTLFSETFQQSDNAAFRQLGARLETLAASFDNLVNVVFPNAGGVGGLLENLADLAVATIGQITLVLADLLDAFTIGFATVRAVIADLVERIPGGAGAADILGQEDFNRLSTLAGQGSLLRSLQDEILTSRIRARLGEDLDETPINAVRQAIGRQFGQGRSRDQLIREGERVFRRISGGRGSDEGLLFGFSDDIEELVDEMLAAENRFRTLGAALTELNPEVGRLLENTTSLEGLIDVLEQLSDLDLPSNIVQAATAEAIQRTRNRTVVDPQTGRIVATGLSGREAAEFLFELLNEAARVRETGIGTPRAVGDPRFLQRFPQAANDNQVIMDALQNSEQAEEVLRETRDIIDEQTSILESIGEGIEQQETRQPGERPSESEFQRLLEEATEPLEDALEQQGSLLLDNTDAMIQLATALNGTSENLELVAGGLAAVFAQGQDRGFAEAGFQFANYDGGPLIFPDGTRPQVLQPVTPETTTPSEPIIGPESSGFSNIIDLDAERRRRNPAQDALRRINEELDDRRTLLLLTREQAEIEGVITDLKRAGVVFTDEQESAARSLLSALGQLEDVTAQVEETLSGIGRAAIDSIAADIREGGFQINEAFENIFNSVIDFVVDDFFDYLREQWDDFAEELSTAFANEALQGGADSLAGLLGSLFGDATGAIAGATPAPAANQFGGTYRLGGNSRPDSNLLIASSGETFAYTGGEVLTFTPPGRSRGGGTAANFNFNFGDVNASNPAEVQALAITIGTEVERRLAERDRQPGRSLAA